MNLTINHISRIFLILLLITISIPVISQTTIQQDLSTIRVDDLNDDQVRSIIRQIEATGLGDEQLEQVAQARGMRPEEVQKLREKVNRIKEQDRNAGVQPQSPLRPQKNELLNSQDSINDMNSRIELAKALEALKPKIFGTELFKNAHPAFEPNLRLPTPIHYQVGPDDQIIINVYGNSLANWTLIVTPEGTINIPGVGILNLSGKTIEQATTLIKNRLAINNYAIGRGTNVSVSLGNIRSIKVIVTGEVAQPGTYTLPSVATVFNALYASGGPSENGSLRRIEVIRNNTIAATLDIYDFLLKGFQTDNIILRDQDVIRVPVYNTRVQFAGEVKRPYIFETLFNETLQDVINFAGGFTNKAYTALIRIFQNTSREQRQLDLSIENAVTYRPMNGDKYFVGAILERFENQVSISGAVFRPGPYQLTPGLTVGQLIRKADGLREDAFPTRGQITRLKDNLQLENVSFNVAELLAGQTADIPLRREDQITIFSISDLKEEYNFTVQGEVQKPGIFKFAEGMSLEDAIILAGNLKESATPQRIEISRRVKNSNALSVAAKTADNFTLTVNQDLRTLGSTFLLQPFDIIMVRPSSGYEIQKAVQVTGEVLYPGPYTIISKNERISDVLKRAGGFTAFAYPEGASLKRSGIPKAKNNSEEMQKDIEEDRLKQLQRLQKASTDSTGLDATVNEVTRNSHIGIDLPAILRSPGGSEDIFLEEGDTLTIPKQLQTVKVSGQVLSPNTVVYIKNKGFKQYVSSAGGFNERALKRNAYIIYANGSVKSTHKLLFFNDYPVVNPGAEIFVPQKADKKKLSATELLGLSTGIASLAAIIISLIRL